MTYCLIGLWWESICTVNPWRVSHLTLPLLKTQQQENTSQQNIITHTFDTLGAHAYPHTGPPSHKWKPPYRISRFTQMVHLSESHLVAQACVTRCEGFFTTNYFTILVPVCKQCTVLGDVIYSVACAAICTFIAPPACKGDLERWIQRSFSRTHENKTVASKFRRKPWISLHPLTKK